MRYDAPRSALSAGGGDGASAAEDDAHRIAAAAPRAPLAGGEHGEAHGEAYGGHPQALVGRRVRKAFGAAGVFDSEVASCRDTRTHGLLWTVHYAGDGDREDMSWQELRAVLLPAEEARTGGMRRDPVPLPSPLLPPRRSTYGAPAARDAAPATPAPPAAALPVPAPPSLEAPAAAALPVSASPPHEEQQRHFFKGVRYYNGAYRAGIRHAGQEFTVGTFTTALEAARAYDAEIRRRGMLVVNFPRPGSNEVQAVRGVKLEQTLRIAALRPGRRGVMRERRSRSFAAYFFKGSRDKHVCLGRGFATVEEAARVVDAEYRRRGLLHLLNVPLNDAERAAVRAHLASETQPPPKKRTRTRKAALRTRSRKASPPTRGAGAAAEDELGGGAAGATEEGEDAGVPPAAVTPSPGAAAVTGAVDPLLRVARKRLAGVRTPLTLQQQARMPHGAAPLASADAAAAASESDDMESFLLGIFPPLRCLHAALDAAAQCNVQRADLVTAAAATPAFCRWLIAHACEELRIDDDGDRAAFARAVEALAPR